MNNAKHQAHVRSGTISLPARRRSSLLVAGIGGWSAMTEIAGAVIAPGVLVVDSNVKKVQHPTGGVVHELLVDNGDHVKAGQVIVRLDETQARSNHAILTKRLDELMARQAREEAERDGVDKIVFPAEFTSRRAIPRSQSLPARNGCSTSGERRAMARGLSSWSARSSFGRRSPGCSRSRRPRPTKSNGSARSWMGS